MMNTDKYVAFFEQVPIALWIEDFSEAKKYIDKVVLENNTDVKTYIKNNPNVISVVSSLVSILDVNSTSVKLYKAKNKEDLLGNLNKVFTEKSILGFSTLLINVLSGEKETEIESINKTLDGEEFDALVKFKVVAGSEDTLDTIIVSIENISKQIVAKKELSESENRHKESQKIAKIGSWFYNFKTEELNCSDEAYRMIGLMPQEDELNLELFLSFVHFEDRTLVNDFSVANLLQYPDQKLKYRVFTNTGELKYISEKRQVIIENDRIIRVIGITQDITESVLSEQKLSTTKNLLSNTLSSIKDGFVILDYDSNYLYVNTKAADFLGKAAEDLIGKNIWVEFPEKEGDLFYDNYEIALKSRKPVSFENYFEPWGKWFENRIIPSKDGMLIFFNEITDKKHSENKIKEAYNIINKSSSVAILCKNEYDFPVVFASENTKKLFGYTHNDLLQGKLKIHEIVHPDDLKSIREKIFILSKSDNFKEIKPQSFRIITENGEVKWVEANFDVIRNDQNKITHIQGLVEDITERKKTEDLFFESNQRLKDLFDLTPLASIIWDLNFKVIEWNKSAERIFGYTYEEAIGRHASELIISSKIISEINVKWDSLLKNSGGFRGANENKTKSGEIIICDWYNVSLKDADGNVVGVASLGDDITERTKSKNRLQESEKKYRDIFEKSIDAVMILKDGFFADCNESALKLFGYSEKEFLLKMTPSQISPEFQPDGISSRRKVEEVIKMAINEGSCRFTFYHQKKNGSVFPAEVSLTKIEESDNQITLHAVVKDITDRIKKEALEDVLYNISKTALTTSDFKKFSLFVRNELHKIINTNNFYIAIYNEETDMITTPVFIDDKENIEEFSAKKSLTGHVIKTKKSLILTKDAYNNLIEKGIVDLIGSIAEKWVGVPLLIQDKCIGAVVVQSYDDEYAYNENDVQLLEFVADQISTTVLLKNAEDDLKNALVKAKESDRLKSAFLANMSHEIRTPMNGIIGFSEFLLEPNLTLENRSKYAKIIINSSAQLLAIVNDILDISKIEAGEVKLKYESVNINKLLDELYAFYEPKAKETNIILNCVKGVTNNSSIIEIDKQKLHQVLNNLLSNAFKFTDEGSIDFGYRLKENKLLFYVKDTGIGIDEKFQNQIFDRFIQANVDLEKKHKGTGLGLAISKKFIELFDGEIWIDSNKKGSTVYFTIPFLKPKAKLITSVVEEQKTKIQVEKQEVTILVAEDEEYNMMYINELFSGKNIKIIEATNGLIAVRLANECPEIDMVFMDIKMPLMNGIDAMIEIKKVKPKLPIIALSAFAMESDIENALSKGFDSYLSKPIDRKKIFGVIEKYSN